MQHPAQEVGQQEGTGAIDPSSVGWVRRVLRIQPLQQRTQALLEQFDDQRSTDGLGEFIPHGGPLPGRTGVLLVSLLEGIVDGQFDQPYRCVLKACGQVFQIRLGVCLQQLLPAGMGQHVPKSGQDIS